MKKERRKTQDLYLLSAYLDRALEASEQQKLEARLAQEPELREKLENLRRTKVMVGALPRLKAPRNFTLTPEMVAVRQPRQPLLGTLRLASALAAILLVVLFGAEWLTGLPKASLAESPAAMEESAPYNDDEKAAATPEPLIVWGAPGATGMGGGGGTGGGGDTESYAMEEPMLEMEAAPAEPEVEKAAPEEQAVGEAPAETTAEEIPADEGAPEMLEETTESARGMTDDGENLILGLNPDEGGEVIENSAPADAAAEESAGGVSVLRWAQIGLAVIAVGGGVAWLILRKQYP